eukprot:16451507-Heterocapsa_arctica.AAC.1
MQYHTTQDNTIQCRSSLRLFTLCGDPLDRVGSKCVNNDQRFVVHLMAMARGLSDSPVPPNTLIFKFDVDVRFR